VRDDATSACPAAPGTLEGYAARFDDLFALSLGSCSTLMIVRWPTPYLRSSAARHPRPGVPAVFMLASEVGSPTVDEDAVRRACCPEKGCGLEGPSEASMRDMSPRPHVCNPTVSISRALFFLLPVRWRLPASAIAHAWRRRSISHEGGSRWESLRLL
jgi:hypothetical protein